MTRREQRVRFTHYLALLIIWTEGQGYEVALDEATEHLTDKDPTSDHMRNSKHHDGLAADLLLYRDGVYLTMTEDYTPLGHYWESLHQKCTWGGRFPKPDGNHFSWGEGR